MLKHYLPKRILHILYNSLILSHLNRNVTSWGFASQRLFMVQKRAMRLITGSKYNAHTEPLFKELSTLTLSDIFKLQCLKLYYKYVHGTLPTYFNGFFTANYKLHHHYTRQNRHIHVAATRSSSAQNFIRYFIPKLLCSLPNLVTDKLHTHSYGGFSNYVKNVFIEKYNNKCTILNCIFVD